MPKISTPSVVDIDIRRRIEEGLLQFRHRDIRGDEDEYQCFLRLCRLASIDPLVSTYVEMDARIEEMWRQWQEKARLLGGNRP